MITPTCGDVKNNETAPQQEQVHKGEQSSSACPCCCGAASKTCVRELSPESARWSLQGANIIISTNKFNIKADSRIGAKLQGIPQKSLFISDTRLQIVTVSKLKDFQAFTIDTRHLVNKVSLCKRQAVVDNELLPAAFILPIGEYL